MMNEMPAVSFGSERKRMYLGWIFAATFFLVTVISAYRFGDPDEQLVAPGVIVMVLLSSVLIIVSVYIFYITNMEDEDL